jgi:hypothetical protein
MGAQNVSAQACVQSSRSSWVNTSVATETSQFTATFSATPSRSGMTGLIGFSSGAASSSANLLASIEFASNGAINARNGAGWSAAQSVSWAAGSTYQFQFVINPSKRTYSVSVTPPGGSQIALATNYTFGSFHNRSSSVGNWAAWAQSGAESVCNMAIAAGSGSGSSGSGSSATAPSITSQPSSTTVTAGGTAKFSVTASGTAPLSYQWSKNGSAISGATSSGYTTPSTTSSDNGSNFTVVVTNSAGSATSSVATLTVTAAATAPTISSQPASITVAAGSTAKFSVSASGTAPLSYQWRKNGSAISGATATTYTTPATTASDNGSTFAVVVSNSAGSVTSSSATLTVTSSSPAISWTPSSLSFGSVPIGTTSTLSVTISSSGSSTTTISSDSISGAGLSASGNPPLSGLMLSPGQTAQLNVTFSPVSGGAISGSAVIDSNASNASVATIPITGTGAHNVDLTWAASGTAGVSYNIYRGTVSGGPYSKIASSISATTYQDNNVTPGGTYYYVVTAVDSAGESSDSNQASASIPTP